MSTRAVCNSVRRCKKRIVSNLRLKDTRLCTINIPDPDLIGGGPGGSAISSSLSSEGESSESGGGPSGISMSSSELSSEDSDSAHTRISKALQKYRVMAAERNLPGALDIRMGAN